MKEQQPSQVGDLVDLWPFYRREHEGTVRGSKGEGRGLICRDTNSCSIAPTPKPENIKIAWLMNIFVTWMHS
jgi:hypothetical protein